MKSLKLSKEDALVRSKWRRLSRHKKTAAVLSHIKLHAYKRPK